jgi:CheY-like chemotaxis protein
MPTAPVLIAPAVHYLWCPAIPIRALASDAAEEASDPPLSGAVPSSESLEASAAQAPERHVLLVDDEADIRTLLRHLLQEEGFVVSEAADGMIALAHLKASAQPLVVLLDYRMPRMNGAEMLEAVTADPQLANRHAFIFVTANLPAFPPALHRLLAAEAIPVIQKPFQIVDILDHVEQAAVRLQASHVLPPSQVD